MSTKTPIGPDDPFAELLGAAPKEAWIVAIKTASDIVRDVLAPLTSTTSGLGRLIQSKFDGFVDLQRVLSADTLKRTHEKILARNAEMKKDFNPSVVITCMEESSKQIEHEIRDLWANLLARELTAGGIHPELPRILARLTSEEANELLKLSKRSPRLLIRGRLGANSSPTSIRVAHFLTRSSPSLSQEILRSVGLIEKVDDGGFSVTGLGRALLKAVAPVEANEEKAEEEADPGLENEAIGE